MELWQLKPVDYEKGDLKRQIAAVVKPVLSMYRFQTMGELRALLSLYRIGMEEVEGTHGGRNYRGLVYTALEENGRKPPRTAAESISTGRGCFAKEDRTGHGAFRRDNKNGRSA